MVSMRFSSANQDLGNMSNLTYSLTRRWMSPIGLKCRTTAQARVASLKRYDDPESDLTFPKGSVPDPPQNFIEFKWPVLGQTKYQIRILILLECLQITTRLGQLNFMCLTPKEGSGSGQGSIYVLRYLNPSPGNFVKQKTYKNALGERNGGVCTHLKIAKIRYCVNLKYMSIHFSRREIICVYDLKKKSNAKLVTGSGTGTNHSTNGRTDLTDLPRHYERTLSAFQLASGIIE